MKKNYLGLYILLILILTGCNGVKEGKIKEYVNELEISSVVYGDFVLPREMNGDNDHVITWKSSDETILSIGTIIKVQGLTYYNVTVFKTEYDQDVILKAYIDMKDGQSAIKEFKITVKEDAAIKQQKINYINSLLKEYEYLNVKESISLVTLTEEYGLKLQWISSNDSVISNAGVYNAPEEDIEIIFNVIVYDNDMVLVERDIKMFASSKKTVEKNMMIDFVTNFSDYASTWSSSYETKTLTNKDFGLEKELKITLSRANKQAEGNAISDRPVIAGKSSIEYITVELENESIKSIEFDLLQWTTKTFDHIYVEYFDGSDWVKCSESITTPSKIKSNAIPNAVSNIRLSIKTSASKNTQVGLSAINIELN